MPALRHLYSPASVKANFRSIVSRERRGYEAVDGLRGLTIILVVFFHCLFGLTRILEYPETEKLIANVPGWLGWAWQARGSDCLFLLCGFLLGLVLLGELKRSDRIDIGRFYYRRALRILPLFFLALLVYIPVDLERNLPHLWSNLLFATNLVPGQKNIIPVGWSLVLQVQFYILVPFVVVLLARTSRKLAILAGVFLLATFIRWYVIVGEPAFYETALSASVLGLNNSAGHYAEAVYYNLHTRLAPFALGLFLAYVETGYGATLRETFRRRPVWDLLIVGSGIMLVWLAVRIPFHDPSVSFNALSDPARNLFYLTANRNIFILGVSLMFLGSMYGPLLGRLLNRFLSLWIWYPPAKLIYAIYLFHFPFIVISAVVVFGTTDAGTVRDVGFGQVTALFGLSLFLTLLFAAFVYVFVERPVINLRRVPAASTPVYPAFRGEKKTGAPGAGRARPR